MLVCTRHGLTGVVSVAMEARPNTIEPAQRLAWHEAEQYRSTFCGYMEVQMAASVGPLPAEQTRKGESV